MNGNWKSLKASLGGFLAAMIAGAPARWMDFNPSTSWRNEFLSVAFIAWTCLRLFGLWLYIPAAISGYVATLLGARRSLEAFMAGLLFIPGSIWLDYLKNRMADTGNMPMLIAIYSLVPVAALGGARLCRALHPRPEP